MEEESTGTQTIISALYRIILCEKHVEETLRNLVCKVLQLKTAEVLRIEGEATSDVTRVRRETNSRLAELEGHMRVQIRSLKLLRKIVEGSSSTSIKLVRWDHLSLEVPKSTLASICKSFQDLEAKLVGHINKVNELLKCEQDRKQRAENIADVAMGIACVAGAGAILVGGYCLLAANPAIISTILASAVLNGNGKSDTTSSFLQPRRETSPKPFMPVGRLSLTNNDNSKNYPSLKLPNIDEKLMRTLASRLTNNNDDSKNYPSPKPDIDEELMRTLAFRLTNNNDDSKNYPSLKLPDIDEKLMYTIASMTLVGGVSGGVGITASSASKYYASSVVSMKDTLTRMQDESKGISESTEAAVRTAGELTARGTMLNELEVYVKEGGAECALEFVKENLDDFVKFTDHYDDVCKLVESLRTKPTAAQ